MNDKASRAGQPTGNHLTRYSTAHMLCGVCPSPIEVGDEITLESNGRWAHWQCPEIEEIDDTPYGRDGDHCPWCGADWKKPHYEDCEAVEQEQRKRS